MRSTILSVFIVLLFSCGTMINKDTTSTIYKEWTIENQYNLLNPDQKLTLSFEQKLGTFSGYSGCNRYVGTYKISGNNIAINEINSTKMYCPNIKEENSFLDLLKQADSYIITGNKLILKKQNLELLILNSK